MKNHFIKAVFLMIFSLTAKGQLFYNKGASIYSGTGSVVKVQGSFTNSNIGVFEHNGLIVIDSTFNNESTAITKGNGVYDVYEHWINSGLFVKDTSSVNLKGSLQHIKGDSISRFYNLSLVGNGVKQLYINSTTSNKLDLSNNELATQQDTMFLINNSPNSLLGTFAFGSEGFVSNLDSGAFVRSTNSTNVYYYPMGSTNGTSRFRPVQVTPLNSNNNNYSVSFHNLDATINTFTTTSLDTSLCRVNDKFYHKLGRLFGNTAADIEIGYIASLDNNFNSIGNWRNSNLVWNDIQSVNSTGFIGSYNSNKRSNWSNFSNLPYSLANITPIIGSLTGDTLVCGGSSSTYSLNSNGNYSYDWGVYGGQFDNNDSTTNPVNITWFQGLGNYATLVITDNISGCSSKSFTYNVVAGILPTAGFSILSPPFTSGTPISIQDSSQNATQWFYDLGNGTTSNNANSQTVFSEPGTFTIYQIVTDAAGCSDTLVKVIAIENTLIIPNVFTPNGDGRNDVFSFNCNGCSDYDLEITNRWGQLMYHGNKGSEFWDGTTGSGEKVTEGTYFYILKIQNGSEEKLVKGFMQLFR